MNEDGNTFAPQGRDFLDPQIISQSSSKKRKIIKLAIIALVVFTVVGCVVAGIILHNSHEKQSVYDKYAGYFLTGEEKNNFSYKDGDTFSYPVLILLSKDIEKKSNYFKKSLELYKEYADKYNDADSDALIEYLGFLNDYSSHEIALPDEINDVNKTRYQLREYYEENNDTYRDFWALLTLYMEGVENYKQQPDDSGVLRDTLKMYNELRKYCTDIASKAVELSINVYKRRG